MKENVNNKEKVKKDGNGLYRKDHSESVWEIYSFLEIPMEVCLSLIVNYSMHISGIEDRLNSR